MGEMILTMRDYDGEVSTVTFPMQDLTAANFDAVIAAGDALAADVADITHCIITDKVYVAKRVKLSALLRAENEEANREQKWLVRYYDGTTFERLTLTVAGSKNEDKDPARRGFALLTDVQIAAFKATFEAFVKNTTGNAVTIQEMEWVGRNT